MRRRLVWYKYAAMPFTSTVKNYIEVLKPRETLLLGFIGLCSVIIAG